MFTNTLSHIVHLPFTIYARGIVNLSKPKNKNILMLYVCVLLAVDLSVWEYLSLLLYQWVSHMYTFTANGIPSWNSKHEKITILSIESFQAESYTGIANYFVTNCGTFSDANKPWNYNSKNNV